MTELSVSPRTLAVLQPGYMPWLGFFDQVKRADLFVIYDDVPFDKHGWRNRNRIKSPQGYQWLSVPVLHRGRSGQLNKEVEINYQQNWQKKHLKTIAQFYAKAPFLEHYLPALDAILNASHRLLIDLNMALIYKFCEWLGIDTPFVFSSALDVSGGRSERLVSICQHFKVKRYLTGNAAETYLDSDLFENNKIDIEWQNYCHPTYDQFGSDFLPFLSILDFIMNRGDQSKEELCCG